MLSKVRSGQEGNTLLILTEILPVDSGYREAGFRGESCPLRALQGRGGWCSWELPRTQQEYSHYGMIAGCQGSPVSQRDWEVGICFPPEEGRHGGVRRDSSVDPQALVCGTE